MESKLLQNFRYKLRNRIARLESVEWFLYHNQLIQFWNFLNQHDIFKAILSKLEHEKSDMFHRVQPLLDGSQSCNSYPSFTTEEDQAAASYYIIQFCVNQSVGHVQSSPELQIGRRYTVGETSFEYYFMAFHKVFVYSLYEYIDDKLDSQDMLLYLLIRYKHKCEWFSKDELFDVWTKNTTKGEKKLAFDLYEYLFDQGLEFHIEPVSESGEIDLISEQVGDERLLVDAKIFNGNSSNIKSGFNQIYTYTLTYNQSFGSLVIFNVNEKQLSFSSESNDPKFSIFHINGKTIFLIVIDIFPRPTASKRGTLKICNLTKKDLIEQIDVVEELL